MRARREARRERDAERDIERGRARDDRRKDRERDRRLAAARAELAEALRDASDQVATAVGRMRQATGRAAELDSVSVLSVSAVTDGPPPPQHRGRFLGSQPRRRGRPCPPPARDERR